jgi:6-pyruvoyltetrahydropterin/6-carboxytetrahydropterin synthase
MSSTSQALGPKAPAPATSRRLPGVVDPSPSAPSAVASIAIQTTGTPRLSASPIGPRCTWVSVLDVAAPRTSVTCSFTFEAAHRLAWHPGKCRNLHGHSYRLDVTVQGPLDGNGVVVDFDHLSDVVQREVIDRWDHTDLNQVLDNPTAELLAHRAWGLLTAAGVDLAALRLWETADSSVGLTAGADA